MSAIIGWLVLLTVILVLVYIMIYGGGPPSGNPHGPGIGGSL
jgi:hypothetical protein